MNERIRELAEQAGGRTKEILSVHGDYHVEFQLINGNIEKFAELIVKECIFEMLHESYLQPNKEVQDFTVKVSERVKEHFGIE